MLIIYVTHIIQLFHLHFKCLFGQSPVVSEIQLAANLQVDYLKSPIRQSIYKLPNYIIIFIYVNIITPTIRTKIFPQLSI